MSRKKTHEEYVAELAGINPNIEVVGEYVNSKTKIIHRCKIDGYEWRVAPVCILRGQGCPRCAGNERYGHEEYVKRVSIINPNIEVVGTYINNATPILHRCRLDGNEWIVKPNSILQGHGCPICGLISSGNMKRKTHLRYVQEVEKINPNIEVVGRYIDCVTNILHRCKIDGYEWMAKPNNILNGKGCPKCNASNGEETVSIWLDKNRIEYESQKQFKDCKDKKPLPFDFYLIDYNCCIEYQGIQHYKPVEYFGGEESLEYTQRHDKIKADYCKNNGITLITISYLEDINEKLDSLFNQNIIKEVAA